MPQQRRSEIPYHIGAFKLYVSRDAQATAGVGVDTMAGLILGS